MVTSQEVYDLLRDVEYNADLRPVRWVMNLEWYKAIRDRKSTRLNSSHVSISYAVFCLKKKKKIINILINKNKKKIKIIQITQSNIILLFNIIIFNYIYIIIFLLFHSIFFFFFFNDTATTEIYTLSLHDALPISSGTASRSPRLLAPALHPT